MKHRILIVDDDKDNLHDNKALLANAGYSVSTASSGQEAIDLLRNVKRDFSLVLMDYHMSGMTGAEAVRQIKEFKPDQQVVAFSLDDTRDVMRDTFRAGVADFIDKNSENDVLLNCVQAYCAKYDRLFRTVQHEDLPMSERAQLIRETGMIGQSESLFQLAKSIRKVAPTMATTLVLGESGTGKELVARALHQQSDRARGPFVAVNIAAESASLLDSSLFGHRKGAFTGAIGDQAGKFQLANKGTIFLDEIGDMSLDLQVKLLRVLQEREVTPLGASRPLQVDVRIVAATHKDLKAMVERGVFREDLYYRLSTVILTTSPLRERPDDIEPLVAHFVEEICKENGFARSIHRRCLEVFRQHTWRGNIRELRSVIERHLISCEAGVVRAEDLDAHLYQSAEERTPTTLEAFDSHFESLKKKLVVDTIKSSNSRAEAARRLGVQQNHLNYYLSKWKIEHA